MKKLICISILICILGLACDRPLNRVFHQTGDALDSLNGVVVYYNGIDYTQSYGSHYGEDGFYYGKKWQCVEYVKRYYHDFMHHTFPDGYGHAISFFDKKIKHGKLNTKRNLIQFENGNTEKPQVNDLVVFDGKYGHVAIVSKVGEDEIEIVQQNIGATTRDQLPLKFKNGIYTAGKKDHLLGWLRKK